MAQQMVKFKATANAHMRRDLSAAGKWLCPCESCHAIRSLVGLEKLFEVWPLVRQLRDLEQQFSGRPGDPEKQSLLDHYALLYDRLAQKMAQ